VKTWFQKLLSNSTCTATQRALTLLQPHGARAKARYLAARLAAGAPGEKDPTTHTEYALALFAAAASMGKQSEESAATAAATDTRDDITAAVTSREVLCILLSSSEIYSPVAVLAAIDPGSKTSTTSTGTTSSIGTNTGTSTTDIAVDVDPALVPALVILHGRLGDHTAALRLLLHGPDSKSEGEEAAESYCEEQALLGGEPWEEEEEELKDATTSFSPGLAASAALLSMYLRRSPTPNLRAAARLFELPSVRLDAVAAVGMVPDDVPLRDAMPFLEAVFRRSTRDRNRAEMAGLTS
jgi:hypothetical protein